MNVLFVLPTISYRGAERYALNCALGLIKKKHFAAILTGRVEKDNLEINKSIKLYHPPEIINKLIQNNFVYFVLTFPIIFCLLIARASKFDITETDSGFSLWASVLIARLFYRKKVIWVVHFSDIDESKSISFRVNKFFARFVDGIKTVVPGDEAKLRKVYGVNHVVGLYPPLDLSRTAVSVKSKIDRGILLVISAIHPRKNLELAVRCMPSVLKEFPGLKLVFLGSGGDFGRLNKIIQENNLAKNVFFQGAVSYERISDYLSRSLLVIVPYFQGEGFTVVPFEALWVGKMCVIAEGSAASEVIKRQKIGIVAKATIEDFSRAILGYLRAPSKFEMLKKRGKKWVKANMSTRKFWKQNLKFYREITWED
ncbi:hypothetical protein A3D84_02355 [Candidatus Woesebacteria bacterium RIFCSPHIGHO2_02_FULL_42_20]|mgnify:CR=1 FL=1|uniref:Glycosyl transferase family 1 domain-containing protein n=1 Tax=Candidatus Woesebacteria bacterium RIFCSPHIGHO2_12_FULL_41_24 TaxID=1802510 RepID=A0A1F8ASR9_9BACT|nr:MAG: hypothetical protein A2W15_00075 [Candidatus Woesebacteria bacterium RBG_16_41_13]OGM29431.1 MAG: hypothetical protein A2873_05060 [Candidatus Woesebacteria bacterium RIFCSPHIGHO2_01_FULL_42_80]OGM35010.1 MAG: hypothetical protein A3D84_02355 [Candidatus Woesebacteria bacterium RIFCSPHIGHO2_02_FULL_42_20]OGM54797.1 MAG: hypothetical protein A3E44_01410 [Candidatus Woesebacteria bacterium RIFCSPHIGHO2_12_FULL_41_24]OGM68325.1 MAG: hypothetical protein A2969_02970 [Candidatus Woesebacteri